MPDDLQAAFQTAVARVRELAERPDNDILLKLYALYKQATEGDACGPKPGFFDFVGTAKHESWGKLKGMSREDAMQRYVELVERLRAPDRGG